MLQSKVGRKGVFPINSESKNEVFVKAFVRLI